MPLTPYRRATLDRIRDTVLEALAPYDVRVVLFGSCARGDARPGSDVDIAVLARGDLPETVVAASRDRLEESTIPYKVDLVDLGAAGQPLRDEVERGGLEWRP